jgi:polysaccharide pyruvyl transferase WcaK-like protein
MLNRGGKTKVKLEYNAMYDRWFVRENSSRDLLGSGKTKKSALEDAKWALERKRNAPKDETTYI